MFLLAGRSVMVACVLGLSGCGGGSSGTHDAQTVSQIVAAASSNKAVMPAVAAALQASGISLVMVRGADVPAVSGARRYAELAAVPWSGLLPGTRVVVFPGSYAGPVTIVANGSVTAPIRIEASDATRLPVVRNSVDIRGSSNLIVTGLQVQSPTWGGFVIRQGSSNITIDQSVVRNAPVGVDITDGAGTGISLTSNLIEDSGTNGISVSTNANSARRNLISRNTIRRSGHHGIELRGSFWRIESNSVSYSGRAIAGTSGIHLYSADPAENSGDDNIVRYNYSYANADTAASDGNGIQVDHWCDRNLVAFNLVWGNDGSGINIFEGADNLVYANTVLANNIDPNKTHGALAEIVLGARPENNRTTRNRVFDNIAASGRANVPAIYVDGRSYLNPNVVGPNLVYNAAGGPAFRWSDAVVLKDAASIDSVTATTGNLVELPAFANYQNPLDGGLRLTRAPSMTGIAVQNATDFAGVVFQPGQGNFGAYLP